MSCEYYTRLQEWYLLVRIFRSNQFRNAGVQVGRLSLAREEGNDGGFN